MDKKSKHQEEVDRNFDAFLKLLPELLLNHNGKFALMHNCQIDGFYDTAIDANTAGTRIYGGEPFSIQQVDNTPANLGFYSYAES